MYAALNLYFADTRRKMAAGTLGGVGIKREAPDAGDTVDLVQDAEDEGSPPYATDLAREGSGGSSRGSGPPASKVSKVPLPRTTPVRPTRRNKSSPKSGDGSPGADGPDSGLSSDIDVQEIGAGVQDIRTKLDAHLAHVASASSRITVGVGAGGRGGSPGATVAQVKEVIKEAMGKSPAGATWKEVLHGVEQLMVFHQSIPPVPPPPAPPRPCPAPAHPPLRSPGGPGNAIEGRPGPSSN